MRVLTIALCFAVLGGAMPEPRSQSYPEYPFAVGEQFEYSAKLGVLKLGTARMAVTGIDTVARRLARSE